MIKLYLIFLIFGILGYFLSFKFSFKIRALVACACFFLPAIIFTILFYFAEDRPTPGSRAITDEMINSEGVLHHKVDNKNSGE